MIEEIGEIILEAGQLAMSINETVVMQKAMLDDVEKHVDSAQDNLINVNSQLKKTLEAKGMSWERMCMIFLCTVFILGLGKHGRLPSTNLARVCAVGVMIPKS
jgi:t-SNARE complex subunit (syntaxin)